MRSALFAGIAFLIGQSAFAGQAVGNGGDLINCVKAADNPFSGTMNLDYVLTYQPAPLAQVRTLDESLDRIQKLIEKKVPGLLESFRKFRGSLWNEKDPSQPYMWTPVAGGLVNVRDEDIQSAERVPDNCRSGSAIPLLQAVIRQDPVIVGSNTVVVHKYVKDKILEVARTNPVQISFLLVHEWLWNLSDNVHRNRTIDRFFHSTEFERMSPDQVERHLKSLGLKIPAYVPYLFEGNLCKNATPTTGDAVLRRAQRYAAQHGIPPETEIPLGEFHVRAVKRVCSSSSGCEAWQDSDYLAQQMQLDQRKPLAFFNPKEPHPVFRMAGSASGSQFDYMDCGMDYVGTLSCSEILDPFDSKPIKVEENDRWDIRLYGATNASCVHLYLEARGGDTGNRWVETRYALFLWFLP